jgi:hypothetical protein
MRYAVVLLLLLSACASNLNGTAQSPTGQSLGAIPARVESTASAGTSLTVTMPDGEVFSGPMSPETVSEGILVGDRGRSMGCALSGDSASGSGSCDVSDGSRVALQW